ncbi:hypothetical protein ACFYYR_24965 [Streptomyces sp. NPDC001922]|uniref:hypothetical protein n=1 Tax=Streptomyces sp. NPDC001922 TaxID=3364624 RepID=UPI0036C37B06
MPPPPQWCPRGYPSRHSALFSRYSSADLETEAGARAALAAFEFGGFRFDTTGWEFTEYDYWFIYTCQIIAWTVAQYDARVPVAA